MKNWWKTFFKPITGEVMFTNREKLTIQEVDIILKKTKNRGSLKILDLACGEGRHSLEFTKRGHEVTGLDFSKDFLRAAKAKAKKQNLSTRFIHGDMKRTSKYVDKNEYDLVVSLFNSFGYFDKRSDDLKMIKEVRKVLKPGGYFVLNTLNGNCTKENLKTPKNFGHEPFRNVFVVDTPRLDAKNMRLHAHWVIADARKSRTKIFRHSFTQNVYTNAQLKNMLRKSGFRIVKVWGILKGLPFHDRKSWHQTIVAQKI